MFERFTQEARTVVVIAQEAAREAGDLFIDGAHLLAGLATVEGPGRRALETAGVDRLRLIAAMGHLGETGSSLDADALAALGIDLGRGRAAAEASFGPGALESRSRRRRRRPSGHLPFTHGAKKALELAVRAAVRTGDGALDGRHVLLGVLGAGEERTTALLARLDVDVDALRRSLDDRDAA